MTAPPTPSAPHLHAGPAPRRVVIVGGGFTGACVAVQLLRHAPQPLALTIVDPAPLPGRGLAYRTGDPDHRLNAPSFGHSLLPDDPWHFSRWIVEQGLRDSDPDALQPDGTVYVRRSDFGRYLEETLAAHARANASGSTIEHRRGRALALLPPARPDAAPAVRLAGGDTLHADLLVLATGNPPPRLPGFVDAALAAHRALLADPFDAERLRALPADARVLVAGSGLTALDALSTLLRRGHRGPLTVLSRHGLRPRPNVSPAGALAAVRRLEDLQALPAAAFAARFTAPPPAWLDLQSPTLRGWLRALRRRMHEVQAAGGTWQQGFDELRDAVWQLWPRLSAAEQRRFLRTLRPWYDVHRFRSPPPNDALVQRAAAPGQLQRLAGRVQAVQAEGPTLVVRWQPRGGGPLQTLAVDALVNCTGLDGDAAVTANPVLAAAQAAGLLQPHASGWGLAVDATCSALSRDGRVQPRLRVFGPPSAGSFGDPLGAVFIGAQVQRALPALLEVLAEPG